MIFDDPNRAIDPKQRGNGHEEKMLLVLKIACYCILDDTKQRPYRKDIIKVHVFFLASQK